VSRLREAVRFLLCLLFFVVVSCGNDFAPVSQIRGVRILAARADHPYARPGQAVRLDLLAVDGRERSPEKMRVFWIPLPCVNPPGGFDEACYPLLAARFTPGVDLTSELVEGSSFSFVVPPTALADSTTNQSGTAYGSVVVFSLACAGHIELVGVDRSRPQASPFRCVGEGGEVRGADDFVFALSRVFVFADRTNENPRIDGFVADGKPLAAGASFPLERCPTPSKPNEDITCPVHTLDVRVPESSQELDPSYLDPAGNPLREALWVDYYVTAGKLKNDVRVVFDPKLGRSVSADELEAPAVAGPAMAWAVVHDNRGGVAWASVSLLVR
jgi:hypothetical protein